jgi:TPP-dependent pyruvate/acetoin dehydrogenase alpha subunit
MEIAQGLYGPFKWAGYEEWFKKEFASKKDPIERTINKTMAKAAGSEKEAEKIRKELEKDREYDIDEAKKDIWG